MTAVPIPSETRRARASDLERMLTEVEEQLGLAECDVESSFLCHELVDFHGYLEEELDELTSAREIAPR